MKILFLSAANSIHTVRWVNALSERGNEVVLVSQRNHQVMENAISEAVRVIYLHFGGVAGYYLNAIEMHNICEREQADVINVHYASGYGTLARIAKLPNVILNVWGSDVYEFPCRGKIQEKILRKNLAYANIIASTSYAMKCQIEKFLDKKRR